MSKELTFSEATLGWRFAHTELFLKNFIKQWELLQDVQIKNLDEYWNINSATGAWLSQIGEAFDTPRVTTVGENAFLLNYSRLNDSSWVLNGSPTDIEDELFRKIILVRSLSTNKLFSMENIADAFYEVFGQDQIKIEFVENKDSFGQFKPRFFRIVVTFKTVDMLRMFSALQQAWPNLFIGKPMGVSYQVDIELDPNL